MDIDLELEEYAEAHTTPETEVLHKLNRETNIRILHPRMLSGHIQGQFLKMISGMIRPKQILEIGTYTGYSAICLAEGLADEGLLHTIEIKPELEEMATDYFNRAGVIHKIKQYIGDALTIIPAINETFDLVFIDADKENYLNYYRLLIDKLKPGGYLLADNVLWSGKVVLSVPANDKETKGIMEFNDFVQNDPRVENVLLPFRDGVMMVRKITEINYELRIMNYEL